METYPKLLRYQGKDPSRTIQVDSVEEYIKAFKEDFYRAGRDKKDVEAYLNKEIEILKEKKDAEDNLLVDLTPTDKDKKAKEENDKLIEEEPLLLIPFADKKLIRILKDAGIAKIEDMPSLEDLVAISGIGEPTALKLLQVKDGTYGK